MKQIILLLRLYINPLAGFSRILDEGRLLPAVLAAIAVVLALQAPRAAEYQRAEVAAVMRAVKARVDNAAVNAAQKGSAPVEQTARDEDMDDDDMAAEMAAMAGPPSVWTAAERFTGQNPTQYLSLLIGMALCFVPMLILLLTISENLGAFTTILFRDYMALLVCCLMAWTAPYLLLALVNGALGALGPAYIAAYNHPALWWAAHAWFLLLTALAVRTLLGAKFAHALGAIAGAWAAAVAGIWLYPMFGHASAYLASPCVLYYLYRGGLIPQLGGLGGGLQSRQRVKQGLENATLNECDGDAHYQLGLIYAQRRQYAPAIERFLKAIEIDPNEADAHYQLGRVAREQGRYAEAIERCRTAARIDDKHSLSEVWRETGIASLLAGDCEGARLALAKYLERRPYDPEGLCWYGRTMAKLGHGEEARAAFDQAIEAVRTMPPARKRQVRSWESESLRELKKLAGSAPIGVAG